MTQNHVVLMQIKDKDNKFASSYNENGISEVLLCRSRLPDINVNPYDRTEIEAISLQFDVYYHDKFQPTIDNWRKNCPVIPLFKVAEIAVDSDTKTNKVTPKYVRVLEVHNVIVKVADPCSDTSQNMASLHFYGTHKGNDTKYSKCADLTYNNGTLCDETLINLTNNKLINTWDGEREKFSDIIK